MLYRVKALFVGALLLAVAAVAPACADDEKAPDRARRHEGTVVSVTADKLVMKGKAKDGEEAKEHTHTLAEGAKVTCDGKECKLEDLREGQKVRVTTQKDDKGVAVRVEALDKNEQFEREANDAEQKDKDKGR